MMPEACIGEAVRLTQRAAATAAAAYFTRLDREGLLFNNLPVTRAAAMIRMTRKQA